MNNDRMDFDMTLHALITEVNRLEALIRQLDSAEQKVLRECSIRINRLVLQKLLPDQTTAC